MQISPFLLSSFFQIYTLNKTKMTRDRFIGAIDQGTTSTRFVIFDQNGKLITWHQMEFEQHYTHPGYVSSHENVDPIRILTLA